MVRVVEVHPWDAIAGPLQPSAGILVGAAGSRTVFLRVSENRGGPGTQGYGWEFRSEGSDLTKS